MAFKVFCDIDKTDDNGKVVKCRREMDPLIDKETGEIYCECKNKLNDQKKITEFAKKQLISIGQILKDDKPQTAYSVKCPSCKRENPPKLKSNKLFCPHCNAEHTALAKPFAQMLKQVLSSAKV